MKHNRRTSFFAFLLILLAGYANANYRIAAPKPVIDLRMSTPAPEYLFVQDGVFVVPSDAKVMAFAG